MTRAWFPFYPADWKTDEDVLDMSLAERGAYVELLGHQWREGSIPADMERLRKICRCSTEEMSTIWPKVSPQFSDIGNGRLANGRMSREWDKAQKMADKASASAEKRWRSTKLDANALPTHCEGIATDPEPSNAHPVNRGDCMVKVSEVLSGSSEGCGEIAATARPPQLTLVVTDQPALDLELIYQAFPSTRGKRKGLATLAREVKTPERYAECVLACRNYVRYVEVENKQDYILNFSTWANCWEEWVTWTPRARAGPVTRNFRAPQPAIPAALAGKDENF